MKSVSLILILFLSFCLHAQNATTTKLQFWRGELSMNDRLQIPFLFSLEKNGKKYKMSILNGEEKIN
ncbi:MAG: hypothetical protein ACKO1R_07645, partial [Crocinitomicaceae bacterium]